MMTCNNCRHWDEYAERQGIQIGRCRRYPPQMVQEDPEGPRESDYPDTLESDWCGEHSLCV